MRANSDSPQRNLYDDNQKQTITSGYSRDHNVPVIEESSDREESSFLNNSNTNNMETFKGHSGTIKNLKYKGGVNNNKVGGG
jgi:flagellar basal body rod protein FlgC